MLLRRLMLQLKRQDWLAIALDSVIIACNVFYRPFVTEWNPARQVRALRACSSHG